MTKARITVPEHLDGERLDKVVATELSLPRSAVARIVEVDGLVVDGVAAKASARAIAGTEVVVDVPPEESVLTPDADVPFTVVYEDADLSVVDKPAGVTVHPGAGRSAGTLVSGLMARYPEIRGVGQEGRWGIVHRLDRETSGLLVVARTKDAYRGLIDAMSRREISRRYLALVFGSFGNTTGTIDAPIGRDPAAPTRMTVDRSGRSARTHYRRVAAWDDQGVSLLSVTLDTGRTHQIRVHMRAIGHPLVGDRVYGRAGASADPGRPWLHANRLTFTHPTTGIEIDEVAPLPDDLAASLAILGQSDTGEIVDVGGSVT